MLRPLNVICPQKDWDYLMEGYFIREVLLGGLQRPVRVFPLELGENVPVAYDLLVVCLNKLMVEFINGVIQSGQKMSACFIWAMSALNKPFDCSTPWNLERYLSHFATIS